MPELPEVETVRRGLVPVMEGSRIARADVRRPDLRWPFPPDMQARLTAKRVLALRRRAKYILADLDSGETLLWHLGMSGRVLIDSPSGSRRNSADFHHQHAEPTVHDHVVFDLENGVRVTFNDPRRFGSMHMIETEKLDTHPLIAPLGPEPFSNSFNADYLRERFHGRRSVVKTALLDQRIVSGLGNIYVCESLYRAGIAPRRQASRISKSRLETLVSVIRVVLAEAIDAGGSSLRDHRQTNGELGYFQHNFKVYDREGRNCQTVACSGTIQRSVQSGRSSFHCPSCQR